MHMHHGRMESGHPPPAAAWNSQPGASRKAAKRYSTTRESVGKSGLHARPAHTPPPARGTRKYAHCTDLIKLGSLKPGAVPVLRQVCSFARFGDSVRYNTAHAAGCHGSYNVGTRSRMTHELCSYLATCSCKQCPRLSPHDCIWHTSMRTMQVGSRLKPTVPVEGGHAGALGQCPHPGPQVARGGGGQQV